MEPRAFSQRDPRWTAERLGTSELTLGEAGCLVTAAASLLASWGGAWSPPTLNEFLRQSHGYVDDCLFLFSALDGIGALCSEVIDCFNVPAPVERLMAAINGGAGVLAMVDWQPGGKVTPHWVWLEDLTDRFSHIMDPWQAPGQEFVELGRYLAPVWTPGRGIFMAAVYSRVDAGQRAVRTPVRGRCAQPVVCLRDGRNGDGRHDD